MPAINHLVAGGLLFSLILALAAFILGLQANQRYKQLYRQYDYFMRGKDAETLEDYCVDLQSR